MNKFFYLVGSVINEWIFNYLNKCGFIFWGSGGGSAPKADPNIGKAALMEAQLGEKQFEFFQQEYEANKPRMQAADQLANDVTKQLLDSGAMQMAQSKDYYDYMQETFRPLEKDLVNTAKNYDTAGRREQDAARGLSDVTNAFDAQRQSATRNNERMGINPNSGNAQALNTQMETSEAIAGADAANKARRNTEMTGIALKTDAANMGKGLPSNALASNNAANAAASGASGVANQNIATQNSGLQVMNQGFEGAKSGYAAQANILNQDYQNRVQAWQASQASNDSMWSGIGSLAGTAGMMMMASDENVKKNIEDIDEEEALEGIKNTPIKKWQYDDTKIAGLDSVPHVGAMAQDLQENLGDDVSDGRQVDVISAIGKNMAATQALAKKVDELTEGKERTHFASGGLVKANTPILGLSSVRPNPSSFMPNHAQPNFMDGQVRSPTMGNWGSMTLPNQNISNPNMPNQQSPMAWAMNGGREPLMGSRFPWKVGRVANANPIVVNPQLQVQAPVVSSRQSLGQPAVVRGYAEGGEVEENPQVMGLDSVRPRTIDNDTGMEIDDENDGFVQGAGTEKSDSIDAKLSKNEFVLNAGGVKLLDMAGIGLDTLNKINKRGISLRRG